MKSPVSHLVCLGLICTFAFTASAETEDKEKKGITFQVVTPSSTLPQNLIYMPGDDQDPVPLVFHHAKLSEPYSSFGESPLKFFDAAATSGEDGSSEPPVPIATFTPPAEDGAYVLVFLEEAETKTWSLHSVPIAEKTIVSAGITFYNSIDLPLQATVAGQQIDLEPGLASSHDVSGLTHKRGVLEIESINPASGGISTDSIDTFNEGVQVILQTAGENGTRPFYNSSLSISPTQSCLVLIFPPVDPTGRRYRVKALTISPPAKPDEAPEASE